MKKKANHPQWALAQKRPGTELRCIRGKYYLYECSSFYDKEKKRTRKKTGAYLGMITEGKGLVPPRRRQIAIDNEKLDNEERYLCRSLGSDKSANTDFLHLSRLSAVSLSTI